MFFLRISRLIDAINERVGRTVYWLILVAVLVSSANATVRYTFDTSSNAWLELQWYLFDAVFLLGSGYTLLRNEHIRIDIFSAKFSKTTLAWIDIVGIILFLTPMAGIIMTLSWPMVRESYMLHEMSSNAGGLIRWPVKALIPTGFLLLMLQGFSELIKRFAFLAGLIPDFLPKGSGGSHGAPVIETEAETH